MNSYITLINHYANMRTIQFISFLTDRGLKDGNNS